ncbi:MAG: hypothetical protein JXQ73_08645 [Phycisphaerae bacterium]|nr:hypothetical protein [Phycisphaerae bacterium]
MRRGLRVAVAGVLLSVLAIGVSGCAGQPAPAGQWWEGQLHCHSQWSDGDAYPEMVADWYKSHGYHFLALTDHNVLSDDDGKWKPIDKRGSGEAALAQYEAKFGKDYIERRNVNGKLMIRLKTLSEIRSMYDEPGRFRMIQGEEITDTFKTAGQRNGIPVHVNAINLRTLIRPNMGKDIPSTIKNDTLPVWQQSEKTGVPMVAILNHPNWKWCLPAEEILASPCVRFFEVYNGGPDCMNHGDDLHASTDRVWDIVLAHRLSKGDGPLLFGVGADDTHVYTRIDVSDAIPGRSWVTARAKELSPDAITKAMLAGDFYASTGVRLKDVRFDGRTLQVAVDPAEGVTYTIQFIGTKKGCDLSSKPVTDKDGKPVRATRRYTKDIGRVLHEARNTTASYRLQGDDLYVRAKVISSKPTQYPHYDGETEVAWTQPVCRK